MAKMNRSSVVSLVPSMAETLLDWGIEPIACTRFCEQPSIRHVGGTKDPNIRSIVELGPDLVVVDAEENRIEDHDAIVAAGLEVHALRIRSVADLDDQLGPLAQRLGTRWLPIHLPTAPRATHQAFVPIWTRPWMALGAPTYGSSLLEALGVANVFADAGPHPEVDLDTASSAGADLVIAPDEPYPFAERHRDLLESVAYMVSRS